MEKYESFCPEDTEKLGFELMKKIKSTTFVAMFGDLGAGKTAFVRGMVKSFLPDAIVTSPTYNIVNEYENNIQKLAHFDMYRITDSDDLYSVGFYDYLDEYTVVCEWCENIPFAIPKKYIKVEIKKDNTNENKRIICIEEIE